MAKKPENFAKLFRSVKYGQILIIKDTHDEQPVLEIRVYIKGVHLNLAKKFDPINDGWKTRDDLFENSSCEELEEFVKTTMLGLTEEETDEYKNK